MQCKGQNVFEMLRRGGAVVKSIHWAGFAAVGASWEPVEDVLHGNNGLVVTHGRAAPVELLGKYVCRAKTLQSLSGRKQTQETPHLMCALDMLQVCDDARAGAVLNDLAHRSTYIYMLAAPQHQAGHALHARSRPPTFCSRTRPSPTAATACCASSTARPGTWP